MVKEVEGAMDCEEGAGKDSLDLSELETHGEVVSNVQAMHKCVGKLDKMLDAMCKSDNYAGLGAETRVKYDLFTSYALNSLFWMYLRSKGRNPARTQVKSEITRVKTYFDKFQKVRDRKTIMPRIDQGAAKRFIRNSLWEPRDKNSDK